MKENQTSKTAWFNTCYDWTKRIIFTLLIIVLLAVCFVGSTGLGYLAATAHKLELPSVKSLNKTMHKSEQKSTMTYANNEKIAVIHSDLLRTNVTSDKISPYVKEALIAIEDPNFYQHKGVVPKSIVRATVSSVLSVGNPSGGSTLTQQLVKQQFLSNETTLSRKAKELLLASRIEQHFSKEDILTTYLNITSFGHNNKGQNIAGIEEASLGIFGVHASQLTLPQAAFLVSLPQSPMVYSPYNANGQLKSSEELEAVLYRKNQVLDNLYTQGKIDKKEYEKAKAYDITKDFLPTDQATSSNESYLYFAIREEAIKVLMPKYYEQDGYTATQVQNDQTLFNQYYEMAERNLSSGGYTVKSTIDPNIYHAMQQAVRQYGPSLDTGNGKTVQVGNILLDNKTGRIYGFVGGRDYSQNQNNHATQTKRSPASTMKPIIAYAPAIDVGLINSQTMLNDFSFSYSNNSKVYNYGKTSGNKFESAHDALIQSDNIPVAHLYRTLLAKHYSPYSYIQAMNMGISEKETQYESAPLGTNNVTVLAQTGAYATLANGGKFNQPYMIEKITDNNGKVIYEHQQAPKTVFKPETAAIMEDMMRDVIRNEHGTAHMLDEVLKKKNETLGNADWAGKTGTSENGTDYWFIASTPSITLSSWVGYDDNSQLPSSIHDKNLQYWADLAGSIQQANSQIMGLDQKFTLPSTVKTEEVSNKTGTKMGSFNYEGNEYNVPGDKVKAYGVNDTAFQSPIYRFGIGGTTEQYNKFWNENK